MVNLFSLSISSSKMYWFKKPIVQKKPWFKKKKKRCFISTVVHMRAQNEQGSPALLSESLSTHLGCYLGSIKEKWKTEVMQGRMYQEKAQKDSAASAKITRVPVFPQGKHKIQGGEKNFSSEEILGTLQKLRRWNSTT